MRELRTILIAEDDPRDQELTIAALRSHNIANEIVVVSDGAEAIDYLFRRKKYADRREENPAVLMLDLKMPKVDGIEVLRRIRSDDSLRLLPVVVLTSSNEEADLVETYSLGVNAYVVKPVDFHEFTDRVRQIGLFWALVNEPPPHPWQRTS